MALQGAFEEHVLALRKCGAVARLVRSVNDLDDLQGLVIPGGESTTMATLMDRLGLWESVQAAVRSGLPTLGTCAGLILLSTRIVDGAAGQRGMGALDISVKRNGYGRQSESFEASIDLDGDSHPFPACFIRAPKVIDSGSATVIARHQGDPVGVRQGAVIGLAFHPELSDDLRLHREFLRMLG
ncbi:MAG TPA: pyridoxal 5'-phosphate synthase glutaminase subunit PdxT [Candidatus Dormibacteraeota bacterium]|jgi:5'-phosphate synthase pdxT subunit|nr:pyridoxal 5'-phosphate synthase glutaminase subunit PdxT [Candidatus Dormibacteraeota bacterium]